MYLHCKWIGTDVCKRWEFASLEKCQVTLKKKIKIDAKCRVFNKTWSFTYLWGRCVSGLQFESSWFDLTDGEWTSEALLEKLQKDFLQGFTHLVMEESEAGLWFSPQKSQKHFLNKECLMDSNMRKEAIENVPLSMWIATRGIQGHKVTITEVKW